jgi:tRNA-specific 2-thiouridylase
VQIRYRGEAAPALVVGDGDAIRVEFRSAQRAIAPGQSVVVYRDDDLLGGGRIVSAFR